MRLFVLLLPIIPVKALSDLQQSADPAGESQSSGSCLSLYFNVPAALSNESEVQLPAASYNISASYCMPTVSIPGRSKTVQLLIHGATQNKFYWSALGGDGDGYQEDLYSWVKFARSRGYHTIAIDRLGVGNSSHPDPHLIQLPMQADITSQIIQQLRHFLKVPPPLAHSKFDNVILVCHSVACLIVNYLLIQEPDVAEAVLLTGYVHAFSKVNTSAQEFAPAASVDPIRFSSLDPGYLTIVSSENMRQSFFGNDGSFDPVIPIIDFEREDVQAIGEQNSIFTLFTSNFANATASTKNPLAIVVGRQDAPLCNGDCGGGSDNLAVESRMFFPDADPFSAMVIENTGHFLNLHKSARETFSKVHAWLEDIGY